MPEFVRWWKYVQLTAESRWPCQEDRKEMSSVLSLELEDLTSNYSRGNPAGLSAFPIKDTQIVIVLRMRA